MCGYNSRYYKDDLIPKKDSITRLDINNTH